MGMIGGLSSPTAGKVLVNGTDIWALSEAAAASFRNQHIGYVFQFASLLADAACDRQCQPCRRDWRRRARAARSWNWLPSAWPMSASTTTMTRFPRSFPLGNSAVSAIARALMNDPTLLLADEPTSDLDEQTEREIMALLLDINRERGTTLCCWSRTIWRWQRRRTRSSRSQTACWRHEATRVASTSMG